MTKTEVPIIVIAPPVGLRASSWTVAYAPLGNRGTVETFNTKAEAMRRAREIHNQPHQQSGTGMPLPWDVTVNWKS